MSICPLERRKPRWEPPPVQTWNAQAGNEMIGAYVAQCQTPANSSLNIGFWEYEASPEAAVSRGPYAGHRLKRPSRLQVLASLG